MTKYTFPTYQYFENSKAPIHIFHGDDDGIIPFKQSIRLLKIKPSAELIRIEKGSHNNLNDFQEYHHKLDSLLRL
jgi:pimeloyl-ACP methyl ester carboxylesterase